MSKASLPANYAPLLKEIKSRIQQAQNAPVLSVNAELVQLYWDIGRMIDGRQQQEGWGQPLFRAWLANYETNLRR